MPYTTTMQVYNTTTQFTAIYTRRGNRVYTHTMADNIPNLDKLVEEVERELLSHIYANLKANEIDANEAQKLAQDFLKLLPFKDKQDLLDKLNILGNEHRTAQEVYVKYGVPFEEQERLRKIDLMREHIKNGDIAKALAVAKASAGAVSATLPEEKGDIYGRT